MRRLNSDHPPIHMNNITNADLLTEADPEIGSECLVASKTNSLRHGLIQNGRYDPSMNDPLKALPSFGRGP